MAAIVKYTPEEEEDRQPRRRSQPPDSYAQSRSALRDRYGTRRIDARPHQSSADMTPSGIIARESGNQDQTPSGRLRYANEQGRAAGFKSQDKQEWRAQFRPRPLGQDFGRGANVALSQFSAPLPEPNTPLDQNGDVPAAFTPPQQGTGAFDVPIKFQLAPTTPPDSSAVNSMLSQIPMPKSLFSGFGQAQRPSIFAGTSKWLKPLL